MKSFRLSFRRVNVPVRFGSHRGHIGLQIAGLNYDKFDRAGEWRKFLYLAIHWLYATILLNIGGVTEHGIVLLDQIRMQTVGLSLVIVMFIWYSRALPHIVQGVTLHVETDVH